MQMIIDDDGVMHEVYTKKEVMDMLEDTRTETSKKKKFGHWTKYCSAIGGEQHYQCTNCKWYINFGEYGEYYTKEFKYCPNCGAKMIKGE